MTLKEIGEFGFIEKISPHCLIRSNRIIKAIGDDAAVFTLKSDESIIVTTDLMVEGIHFLRHATSGFDLGYKSLAVNLSDIAAMGGTACEAFVSIAIPDNCPVDYLESFYEGMKKLAFEFDVNILGGDTTRSNTDLVINIAIVGSVCKEDLLCRDQAKPGDTIHVTGFLGDSRAGLDLILNEFSSDDSKIMRSLMKAHSRPSPHLKEGRFLATQHGVRAGIDVSDGLLSDLNHISKSSQVGARLFADKIPLSENLKHFCQIFNRKPLNYALNGGEDYVLICTIAPGCSDLINKKFQSCFNRPLFTIGEIIESEKLELALEDGTIKMVQPNGWDHFKVDTYSI